MAFNRNIRQTDTGGRDTRSTTPTTVKGLTREEILERQRKLREAAERKRLAEQAAKNVGANARASAPVTQKDVLAFRDKNNYPAWYSRTQNTQNVYKPQTLDTIDGTIQVSSPSPGLTSRWSLGNEPGVTVDVAAELSGGEWYMPGMFKTRREYEAYQADMLAKMAQEAEQARVDRVSGITDYNELTSLIEQMAMELRDEQNPARRAEIQGELDWLKDYAAKNFARGSKSAILDMDSKAAAQERALGVYENRLADVNKKYEQAQRGVTLDPNAVDETNARFNSSLAGDKTQNADAFEMDNLYQRGNVDLMNRPVIDTKKLLQAGWENAGEGFATVYSSFYTVGNGDEYDFYSPTNRIIHVTPILQDGSVLSPQELESYVKKLSKNSNVLAADSLKVVLSVDEGFTDLASAMKKADDFDVGLHEAQAKIYETNDINAQMTSDATDSMRTKYDEAMSQREALLQKQDALATLYDNFNSTAERERTYSSRDAIIAEIDAIDDQISAIDGAWDAYDPNASVYSDFVRQKISEAQEQYNADPYKYSGEEMNSAAQGLSFDQYEAQIRALEGKIGATQDALHGIAGTEGKTDRYYLEMNAQNGYTEIPKRADFAQNSKPVPGQDIVLEVSTYSAGDMGTIQRNVEKIPFSEVTQNYMTPEELAVAYYLRNTQGNDAAAKYIQEYLKSDIAQRESEAMSTSAQTEAANAGGLEAVGGTLGAAFANRYLGAVGMADVSVDRFGNWLAERGIGEFKPVDIYNPASNAANAANEYKGTISGRIDENAGGVASFLYDAGVGIVESAAGMVAGPVGAGVTGGLSAGNASYRAALDRGLDEDAAYATAGAAAIFESLFEYVSVEKLFSMSSPKSALAALKNVFKQGAFEASEEVATTLANFAYDNLVNGGMSEINQRIDELQAGGMDYNSARKIANSEWGQQLALDAAGGLISGGVFAAGNQTGQYLGNRNDARTPNSDATNKIIDGMPLTGLEAPVQPADSNTGKPSPGTPNALKEAADARKDAYKAGTSGNATITGADGAVETVTPKGIVTVGQNAASVMIAVEKADGTTAQVPVNEVEFSSDAEAQLYNYASGMPTPAMAEYYRETVTDGQVLEDVAAGMLNAYEKANEGGWKLETVQNSVLSQGLTDEQIKASFLEGMKDRGARVKAEQAAAEARQAKETDARGVVEWRDVSRKALAPEQRTQVDLASIIVSATSRVKLQVFQSKANADETFTTANGYYNTRTGAIGVDVNAGRNKASEPLAYTTFISTLSHELTHKAQTETPELYEEYRALVLEYMQEQGMNLDEMIDTVMANDKSVKLREDALDEIVANASSTMLRDSDYVDNLLTARGNEVRTIGQKVLAFVRRVKAAIQKAVAGNPNVRREAEILLRNIDKFSKKWSDMMIQATGVANRPRTETKPAQMPVEAATEAVEAPAPQGSIFDEIADERQRTGAETTATAADDKLNMSGTVGTLDEPAMPEYAHIDQRTPDGISDTGVHAFMNDYKMSRLYMGQAAKALLWDAQQSLPGGKFFDPSGTLTTQNRQTTNELAHLMDSVDRLSWKQLTNALQKISDVYDAGDLVSDVSNAKLMKQIELSLDRVLTEGYTTLEGVSIAPDLDYIEYKRSLPGAKLGVAVPSGAVAGSFADYVGAEVRNSARSSDAAYLAAVERGDMETAQKMVDEAAKAAGYTVKAFHGTDGGNFTRFDYTNLGKNGTMLGIGHYFTTDKTEAQRYGGRLVEAHIRAEKPLSAENATITESEWRTYLEYCHNHIFEYVKGQWKGNRILVDYEMRDFTRNPNDNDAKRISEFVNPVAARNTEVTNALLKMMTDSIGYDSIKQGNVYVVFSSDQIKSADPVTYSDDGSVIPLSERFNAGSEDIRYSVRDSGEVDSDGNTLSEAQARFFRGSVIRDEEGNLIPMYHGTTAYKEFTVFKRGNRGWLGAGIYFTSDKNYAQRYAEKDGPGGRMYSVYLDVKNPLVVTSNNPVPEVLKAATGRKNTYANRSAKQANDAQLITTADIKKLEAKGYDGIVWRFGGTYEVSVFSANQAKRVDNKTPTASPDIRYSARDMTQISDREILATAFETVAQNENERGMLADYRKRLKEYDALQADWDAKRARIKELSFGKYERTPETRAELVKVKNQANVLAKRVSDFDKRLLKFEAAAPLRAVVETQRKTLDEFYKGKITEAKLKERMSSGAEIARVKRTYDERIKAIREQRDAKVEATKQAGRERIENLREGRKDTETRHKMLKIVDEFNKRLIKPREGFYVPDSLRDSIMALNEGDIKAAKGDEAQDKLARILTAYEAIKDVEGFETAYDAQHAEYIKGLVESIASMRRRNGKPISVYDLKGDDLRAVYNALRGIKHSIVNAVKLVSDTKNREATALGLQAMQELTTARGKYSSDFLENRVSENLDAYGAFMRYGNMDEEGAWAGLYNMISNGELDKSRFEQGGNAIFEPLLKGSENLRNIRALRSYAEKDLVDVGFKDATGNAVKMARGQMVMAYLHLDSPQNLLHVMYGGLTLPDLAEYYNHQSEAWGTGARRTAGAGTKLAQLWREVEAAPDSEKAAIKAKIDALTQEEYARLEAIRADIESRLTEYERKFIAASREFLDGYSKRIMNEASMKRFGYEIATEEKYVPIKSNPKFIKAKFEAYVGEMSLENIGIAKSRIEGASNPILLYDVTDAMRTHISKVAMYAAMINPVHDFSKVFNVGLRGHENTLQAALSAKFGERAYTWVKNYIQDAQGLRDSGEYTFFDKTKGNYSGGVLIANIGSALKNYTSYFGAAAEVGWKHTIHALARGGKNNWAFSGADKALIGKYTPMLNDRMRGMTTKELGDINKMIGWGGRIGGKLDVAKLRGFLNILNKTDAAATGRIWYAAQYYVDEQFPGLVKGTQEQIDAGESPYYKKVAEVYNKSIQRTQQTYTASQLADVLRNPDKIVRSMTMFMSQPLKQFGMVYTTTAELRAKSRAYRSNKTDANLAALKKARIKMANTTTAFVVMNITEILAGAVASALYHSVKRFRDDDDELTWESFFKWFGIEYLNNMIGTVAYGNIIGDFITPIITGDQYYGVESGAIAPINDLATATYRAVTGAQKLFSEDYESEAARNEAYAKYLKGAGLNLGFNLSRIFGIPAQNIYNFGNGLYLHALDALNGEFLSFEAGTERAATTNYRRMFNAILADDTAKVNDVLAELVDAGKDEATIAQGMRNNAIKPALLAGTIDAEKAMELVEDYGGKTADEAYWLVKEWQGDETSEDGEFNKYAALREAVVSGSGIDAARNELSDHGVTEEEISKQMRGAIKEAYYAGAMTTTAAQSALVKHGLSDNKNAAYWLLKEWDYAEVTGDSTGFSRYDEFLDAVPSGGTSMTKAANELLDHGVDKSDAAGEITKAYKAEYLALKESNPAAAERMLVWLLDAYEALGYERDYEYSRYISKWK